jgi:regulator of sirC expression with transglutaminase-like and TPR domain
MFKQREAIIRLLRDDDPDTVLLTKHQLAQGGTETIPDLRDLLELNDDKLSLHIREILSEIESRDAKDRFTQLCSSIQDGTQLEQACWLLAQIFLPGIEIDPYIRQFDHWGDQLAQQTRESLTAVERVRLISSFLGHDLGFRGNTEDYYNLRNSLLPCVVDSRLGIPISLSVIYMSIARRASLQVEGVNLPGHFVVRHADIIFDPFYQGRVLTPHDCAEILAQQKIGLHPTHLEPTPPRLILLRILANILHIFEGSDEDDLQTSLKSWIQIVEKSPKKS